MKELFRRLADAFNKGREAAFADLVAEMDAHTKRLRKEHRYLSETNPDDDDFNRVMLKRTLGRDDIDFPS